MSSSKISEINSIEELGYEDSTNVVLHELGNMIMLMDFSIKKIEKTYKEIENDENFKYLKEDTKEIIGLIASAKEKSKLYQLHKERTYVIKMLRNIVDKYRERCASDKIDINLVEDLSADICICIDKFKFSRVIENIIINAIEELEMCSNILTRKITIKIYKDTTNSKDNISNRKIETECKQNYEMLDNFNENILNINTDINRNRIGICDNIIISINNTGRVIEKENLKNIFNPYFTSKEEGTGIGLSFCEKIVKLHNGKIKVVSNKKSGTTFIIKIPIQ